MRNQIFKNSNVLLRGIEKQGLSDPHIYEEKEELIKKEVNIEHKIYSIKSKYLSQ